MGEALGEPVVDDAAVASGGDEAGLTQGPQPVGGLVHGDVEGGGDVG